MLDCWKKTDKDIVDLVVSWDIDAYYCIVNNYKDKLIKYILRISNISLEDAENLLQEVFIKSYEKINSYNDSYSFSSWIYRITHNTVIDYHRKNRNSMVISIDNEDEEYKKLSDFLDSGINIELDMRNKELVKKILEILNLLEDRYKEILILKFLEEKSYDEISDILKIPTWTVATLINRWKKQFKQKALENNLDIYL